MYGTPSFENKVIIFKVNDSLMVIVNRMIDSNANDKYKIMSTADGNTFYRGYSTLREVTKAVLLIEKSNFHKKLERINTDIIQSLAVMDFVNMSIQAFEHGSIEEPSLTLVDLYQTARNHVKSRYSIQVPSIEHRWSDSLLLETFIKNYG